MRVIGRLAAAAALAWVAGFLWFALTLPGPAPAGVRTDGVVALTGGGGRVERGLTVLARRHARRLLVSGVDPAVRPRELAAATGASARLVACCVDLGKEAVDTRSNAEETAAWARRHRVRSLRVVTSSYHMRRALTEFRAELPGVRLVPDAVAADPSPAALAAEYTKWLWRTAARAA